MWCIIDDDDVNHTVKVRWGGSSSSGNNQPPPAPNVDPALYLSMPRKPREQARKGMPLSIATPLSSILTLDMHLHLLCILNPLFTIYTNSCTPNLEPHMLFPR